MADILFAILLILFILIALAIGEAGSPGVAQPRAGKRREMPDVE